MDFYEPQGHHGEFELGKVQYSTPNFFWPVVSYKSICIKTQNPGKAQALGASPAMAALPSFDLKSDYVRNIWMVPKL